MKGYPFPLGYSISFPGLPLLGLEGVSPGQGRIHVLGHSEEWTVFGVQGLMSVSHVSSSLFLDLEFSERC